MLIPTWNDEYLIFNDSIVQESEGSPRFATRRIQAGESEVRRQFRARARWALDLSGLQLSGEQYEELLAFQLAVKGMLNPFLVRNVRNCLLENEAGDGALIGVGDGATTEFQLQKTYSVQGRSTVQTVSFPNWNYPPLFDLSCNVYDVLPSLRVAVAGADGSNEIDVTPFLQSVGRNTGLVRLGAPPTRGQLVRAYGGFYTRMIANQDDIPVSPKGAYFMVKKGTSFEEPVRGA